MSDVEPLAYFLTWTTYGTWLPGDARGWTRRKHGSQLPDADKERVARRQMRHAVCQLSDRQRRLVEATISEHCRRRGWTLLAVNCRTNHVHVVVAAAEHPDRVRGQFKLWCTRALRSMESSARDSKKRLTPRTSWWTEGGSGRYLNDERSLEAAILYVRDGQ